MLEREAKGPARSKPRRNAQMKKMSKPITTNRLANVRSNSADDVKRATEDSLLLRGHVYHNLHRFQEAEAVARLQHPNIVQIHEVGEMDGKPYFSLEYVDGGTLRTI